MPCDTCGHALARTGSLATVDEAFRLWHCDRCGTAVVENLPGKRRAVYAPQLVERCRSLLAEVRGWPNHSAANGMLATLRRLGITEACGLPDERPGPTATVTEDDGEAD